MKTRTRYLVNEVNDGSPNTDNLAEVGEAGGERGDMGIRSADKMELVGVAGEMGDDAGISLGDGADTTILVPSADETVIRLTSSFVSAPENVESPCQLLDLGRVGISGGIFGLWVLVVLGKLLEVIIGMVANVESIPIDGREQCSFLHVQNPNSSFW